MIGDRYKDVYYSNNDTVYKPIPPLLAAGNTKKTQHFCMWLHQLSGPHIVGAHHIGLSIINFFHLACFQDYVRILLFFKVWIPLCAYTIFSYLSSHQTKNIWILSTFGIR